jgi:hypothetical protein
MLDTKLPPAPCWNWDVIFAPCWNWAKMGPVLAQAKNLRSSEDLGRIIG